MRAERLLIIYLFADGWFKYFFFREDLASEVRSKDPVQATLEARFRFRPIQRFQSFREAPPVLATPTPTDVPSANEQ